MSEFSQIMPGDRNRTDYAQVPSEAEFFAKIQAREDAITKLNTNAQAAGIAGRVYRQRMIKRINRQSPFDKYLLNVWARVQEAGWATGEKFRLQKLFGTSDDWQIAYLLAKSTFEKKEAEAVRVQYAETNTASDVFVRANIGDVGPQAGGIFNPVARFFS